MVELKFSESTKYWDGLTKQLLTYMNVEDISDGIYLIIAHYKEELKKFDELKSLAIKVGEKNNINMLPVCIDASLDKPSASHQ